MTDEPIRVDSVSQQMSCEECGRPSGIFSICKDCDYAWLQRMRKESERG